MHVNHIRRRAYACIPSLGLDAEASNQLRFLVHALCLRRLAAAGADPEQRYAQIMVLQVRWEPLCSCNR